MTGWPARDYELTSSVTASHAAKVVVSASRGIRGQPRTCRILDRAIGGVEPQPPCFVILRRPQAPATLIAGHDVDWEQAMAAAEPVGLEYTIMAVTCFFSQRGGAVRRRSGTRA